MTTLLDSTSPVKHGSLPTAERSTHETAIAEIVGMILDKYTEDGDRSFAIGKRAIEHAQWQKGNFPEFGSEDFDTLMRRIRDDVRVYVSIKAESIRVAHWTRCHVLRELVREVIADRADSLSMFEYLSIVGKALSFSTGDLEGDLNPGWLDMIRGVAYDRAAGKRVTSEDFKGRIAFTLNTIADAMSGLSPEALAAKAANAARIARKRAVAKANEDITSSLSDGLSGGHISAEGALAILETVAKEHGISLPSSIGFDPARCTDADCDLLASTMFQANKHAEMVRLRDRLSRMVEGVDRARAASHGLSNRMSLRTT